MKLTDSRGPGIDTEKCVAQIGGNRFDLVLVATVRARELSRRHKAAGLTTQVNSPVSALLDIQEGKIGREYLKKVDEIRSVAQPGSAPRLGRGGPRFESLYSDQG